MIDYFLVSKVLLGLIISVLADFFSELSPHYGIELKLRADLLEIENLTLVQPSLPKNLDEYDASSLEENSFQSKVKPKGKIEQRNQREAKLEEIALRNANDGELWETTFASTPTRSVLPEEANTTSSHVEEYFEKVVQEKLCDNKVTGNLAVWCQTLQKDFFSKCGAEIPKKYSARYRASSGEEESAQTTKR